MRNLLLAVAVLLTACRPRAESPEYAAFRLSQESAAARTGVDAINIRYMRYMNSNMADSVATLFMDNAALIPPNAPALLGKDNIRKFFADNPIPPGAAYTFAAADVHASGPLMVELGEYELVLPASGSGTAQRVTGKYVAHWQNVNGRWLQAALIWNEDAPRPSMPAAPAPKPGSAKP